VTVQISSNVQAWQSVTNIVTHPNLDVAILTFDGHHTNKKKLVLDGVTPAVGEQIRLAGFGRTHTGSLGVLHTSGPLQRVSCNMGDGIICASSGSESPKSSCGGDSGGPWFQFRDNQELVELVGVNAFGYDGDCGEHDKKTGLVSVAYIKDWILQHAPEFEFTDDISCSDSDFGATDNDEDGCDWYTVHDTDGDHCGKHDDPDFSANVMCCRCGGGSTSTIQTISTTDGLSCSDTANGALDVAGDGCDWYNEHDTDGDHCGKHDDPDFSANVMCCRCGGGSTFTIQTISTTDGLSCSDTANGALDAAGDGCDWYMSFNGQCGTYDDHDFSANVMCCHCGGGSNRGEIFQDGNCKTIGSAGVGAGHPCVFPFTYQSTTYDTCTKDGHDELWCATQTLAGNYVVGMWGDCSCSDMP
jgi:hypothetical protein